MANGSLLLPLPHRLALVEVDGVLKELDGRVGRVNGENRLDGEAVLGHVGPVLVEDEVAEGVDDWRAVVGFDRLGNMGMVTDNEVCSRVDEEVGEFDLAG